MDRAQGFFYCGLHYRLEKVKCGKAACKSCPHGPYWYAYDARRIFLKKSYVGKRLPADVAHYAPAWAKALDGLGS